ncbi:16921_t:CDS:2 [Acaulospora colombiana]|uniref:16921_t:CDS:1 n=1 Tax=Acaulospora colombiana TaxID=27376 RepID=A0ACA9LSN0_9GLOM|nr:16921_t:CDS:2 [Acaulospora colombiana]
MDSTDRLPSELFIEIFKKLDVKSLCTLAKVSHALNILSSDNHIWSALALKRWKNKQGMKDICDWKGIINHSQNDNDARDNTQEKSNDDNLSSSSEIQNGSVNNRLRGFELWFSRPGVWKRVYAFVEAEAKRCRWDDEDLIDNVWLFRGDDEWSFPVPQRIPSSWGFKMTNHNVTFESLDTQSFKRKLKEFERCLLIEFGMDVDGNDYANADEGSDSQGGNNLSDDNALQRNTANSVDRNGDEYVHDNDDSVIVVLPPIGYHYDVSMNDQYLQDGHGPLGGFNRVRGRYVIFRID